MKNTDTWKLATTKQNAITDFLKLYQYIIAIIQTDFLGSKRTRDHNYSGTRSEYSLDISSSNGDLIRNIYK